MVGENNSKAPPQRWTNVIVERCCSQTPESQTIKAPRHEETFMMPRVIEGTLEPAAKVRSLSSGENPCLSVSVARSVSPVQNAYGKYPGGGVQKVAQGSSQGLDSHGRVFVKGNIDGQTGLSFNYCPIAYRLG